MKRLFDRAGSLVSELRRRKVFRVAAVYVATAFVIAQAADIFLPGLGLPDWTLTLVLALLILGFPLAVALSWMFDLTPEGIRRTTVSVPSTPPSSADARSDGSADVGPRPGPRTLGTLVGGRYELGRRIGAGAMGVVHRARDTRLQREVALKFLPEAVADDSAAAARFLQEARAAAALNHPNITTLHAIEDDGDHPFLVMELVEGETLEARLARSGPLAADEAVAIASQVAAGLQAAHDRGIVHRDIKPANLMLTPDGRVKIMDFGIAKLPGGPAMTRVGSTLGSAAYMSPEQVRGDEVDGRSDVWALGVVLYEALAGRLPFPGDNEHTVLHGVLHVEPVPIEEARSDLPEELIHLIARVLEKDPATRPASARDLLLSLRRAVGGETVPAPLPAPLPAQRGWGMRAALLVPLVLAALIPAAWLQQRSAAASLAREVELPALMAMVEAQDCLQAMIRAEELERVLGEEWQLDQARSHCSVPTTITSEPAGARISLRTYGDTLADWYVLGTTPLNEIQVPEGLYHWRIETPGHEPIEGGMHSWQAEVLHFTLIPEGDGPAGMVPVAGGPMQVMGIQVTLAPFWIDRFEITNGEFQAFVDDGGYRRGELWEEVTGGTGPGWDEARSLFVDTTGQPGPATWELGRYPEGEARHPVTGVSWYEAVAYCRWAGKELPTAFHWRMAAGTEAMFSDILWFSNLDGRGPSPVGAHPGISPYGAYDMAGNAKEWTWNSTDGRRYILGGGWNEPSYMFSDLDARPPGEREPVHGFRCARYDAPPPAVAFEEFHSDMPIGAFGEPAGDEEFRFILRAYAYDDTPLNARLESVDDESPFWRRETVTLDAAYGGERLPVHLYIPRDASPPYQAVLYYPSGAANRLRSSTSTDVTYVTFIPRSGRVLVRPVLQGMYERRLSISGPQAVRELLIQRTQDLQRTVDYLLSREDIDPAGLAYFGLSLGANAGPISTAVEDRFAASVLVGGGLLSYPHIPEIHPPSFAPRVRVPTLMVNGRQDFMVPHETSQLPLFERLGTPEEHKRLQVFEGGHVPDTRDVIRETNAWLDRYLGPVR
jgi:eukaryotic-like serine/threonine-protein kinase